jgi:hypothetical protein
MALFVDQQGKMYIYRANVEADFSGGEHNMPSGKAGVEARGSGPGQRQPLVVPAAVENPLRPPGGLQQETERLGGRLSGRIRVFRDRKGFTHIVNSQETKIHFAAHQRSKPMLSLVSGSQETPATQQNLARVLPPPGTLKNFSNHPEGLDSGFSRIVSFLDKAGRLNINNSRAKSPDPRWAMEAARLSGKKDFDLEALMAMAARHYRLPLPLVKAVVRAESGFVPEAVSWKGAMGLMQLMPTTAACLGVKDPFCPQENIMGGCRYLRDLLDRLHGSVPLSLAAYNAGLQRVINSGYQIPAITETQDFVEKVIGYLFGYLQQTSPGSRI